MENQICKKEPKISNKREMMENWPQISNGMVHRSLIFLTIAFIQSDKWEENNNLIPGIQRRRVTQSKEKMSKNPNKR